MSAWWPRNRSGARGWWSSIDATGYPRRIHLPPSQLACRQARSRGCARSVSPRTCTGQLRRSTMTSNKTAMRWNFTARTLAGCPSTTSSVSACPPINQCLRPDVGLTRGGVCAVMAGAHVREVVGWGRWGMPALAVIGVGRHGRPGAPPPASVAQNQSPGHYTAPRRKACARPARAANGRRTYPGCKIDGLL
jgi:hypothetical protein